MVTGLTAGTTYNLAFMMSKNPVLPTASMDVLWLTADPATNFFTVAPGTLFSFTAANTSSNMLWSSRSASFVATASSMFLGFRSLETSTAIDFRAGAALDAVSLSPATVSSVPEPSTNVLVAGGLLLMFTMYRRRRGLR